MGRINAWSVDDSLLERFKKAVIAKHGKLHKAYSEELEKAIKLYLEKENYDDTHAHIHRSRKSTKEVKPESEREEIYPAYANGGESEVREFPDPKESQISPSERIKRKIIRYLEENGMMEAESISENAVRRVIGIIAGHDKRTIDKYFRILEEEDLLPENMERTYPQRLERYPHFKR